MAGVFPCVGQCCSRRAEEQGNPAGVSVAAAVVVRKAIQESKHPGLDLPAAYGLLTGAQSPKLNLVFNACSLAGGGACMRQLLPHCVCCLCDELAGKGLLQAERHSPPANGGRPP